MKIVDLSAELAHHMPRYPSSYLPDVEIIPAATHEKEARSAQIVRFGSHVSTHMDAPYHSIPTGKTIDQIDLHVLVGPARILRFGDRDRKAPLLVSDFKKFEGLEKCEKIILDTGWSRRTWGSAEYFTEGPFFRYEVAEFLAGLPKLHLIGMDFPNIDCCEDMIMGKPAPNHRIILGKDIVMVENLLNLHLIPDEVFLNATTPRVVGGDGFPCRALAMFPLAEIPVR